MYIKDFINKNGYKMQQKYFKNAEVPKISHFNIKLFQNSSFKHKTVQKGVH